MGNLTKEELESQMTLLVRGCEAVYAAPELAARLESAAAAGRQLRVKYGMDPTAPDIHLGHTVVLRKMRQFQDLGHKAVLIIGDYTARVGDPSGANKTRPMLSPEQIEANAATYIQQAGKVLDTSPEKLEIRRNSEWLAKWTFADILKFASQMTVARMMERDTFEIRYKAGIPIGVHEFLYPLMQGYDSICIQADVELGGSDQTFNCLVGRDFQENAGQARQVVVIMPILVGLDGVEKMSKSKGNYIGVAETPKDMFGKVMSIPDALMANYFTLLTELPPEEIKAMTDPAKTHPRQAKAALGKSLVAQYHGAPAGEAAAAEFDRVFSQKQTPTEMVELAVDPNTNIVQVLLFADHAETTSECRRLIKQGAVSLDGRKILDEDITKTLKDINPAGEGVLRTGKRRFTRLKRK